jgi:hypothetical protein
MQMQHMPTSPLQRNQSPLALRGGGVLAALSITLCVAIAYWPGLYGYWGRDDFMQLAFARLIGSPWPLFLHDHYFPGPGSIFRPLGFASFWLWQALFGTNYFAHAFADMLLHAGVSLALFRVVRLSGLDRVPAALCTLLFALHPAVLGTALWWSARFDLLAALFAFIALRAAFDYMQQRRNSFLLITLAAALAALLSKETAAALLVAVALIWSRWAWRESAHRAAALRAVAALFAIVVLFFLWRWAVLGTAASGLAGEASLAVLTGKGVLDWIRYVGGYVSFWPRLGIAQRIVAGLLTLALIGCGLAAWMKHAPRSSSPRRADLLLCGLCLFLLPAVLQAPVVALNATSLRGDVSAIEAAMQSRLYYLSIGGFVIALSALVQRIVPARTDFLRFFLIGILGIGAFVLGWASRDAASAYASRSLAPKAVAEAAAAAVDGLTLPASHCHVFLLGVEPPAEWSVYVSMDSVVKALSADLPRIGRCFIHDDYSTFFHLMGRSAEPGDAAPYRLREVGGQPLSWLHVGDAVVAYLDPPLRFDADMRRNAVFLRYEKGSFRDVTGEVFEGRVVVVPR